MMTAGFLHPGAMGSTIAGTYTGRSLWASEGRSAESATRAETGGLEDIGTVDRLVAEADIVVSVCPPGAALDLAQHVASLGFDGIYVDANAVAPNTSRAIASHFDRFVDGAIIGPPVNQPGSTRMYLSGPDAAAVAAGWADTDLEVRLVDGGAGAASAVKMAFAAWTKGTSALLLAIRAMAEAEGVSADLVAEWETSMPDLITRSDHAARGVGPKAWRFGDEMREIAATFDGVGLPDGFHRAAGELYDRLAEFKNADPGPSLDDVLAVLKQP